MQVDSFQAPGQAARAYYQREGVVCLRQVIEPRWLECCRKGVDKSIAQPGQFFRDYTSAGSPSRYTFEFWAWQNNPELRALVLESSIGSLVAELLEADRLIMLMDQWLKREAGSTNAAPWHHDEPYFDFFGGRKCVVWFPLEAMSLLEGLTFIGGSHQWGKLYRAQNFAEREPFDGDNQPYHETEAFTEHQDRYLGWSMQPGDCVIFDFRTLHRATADQTALDRTLRRMTLRYGDDDVLFKPRGSWTEELSTHLQTLGQRAGKPINCELCPVVYPPSTSAAAT